MPSSRGASVSDVSPITPAQLAAWLGDEARAKPLLLDVREPWEYEKARIQGATLIPMREVPARVAEIDDEKEVVAICHHGGRSLQVAMFLEKQGFKRVHNLMGGIDAWSRSVDPAVPLY
jgi:rhodanese-related sulfurtransferase